MAKSSNGPKGMPLSDLPGLMASLPRLTSEEAEGFAADLDAARDDLRAAGLRARFASFGDDEGS